MKVVGSVLQDLRSVGCEASRYRHMDTRLWARCLKKFFQGNSVCHVQRDTGLGVTGSLV